MDRARHRGNRDFHHRKFGAARFMSYLHSLPPDAGLLRIFQAFPEAARPLLEYHQALLRGDSPFSAGERELIAAYVSGLNSCNYCRAVHSQTAVALGIDTKTITNLLASSRDEDIRYGTNASHWRIDVRMRPVLALVQKLTLAPGKIAAADVDAVFVAGWDDHALHDAVAICGLFNLMNRLVNGLGLDAPESYTKMAAQRLADGGYAQLLDFLPAPVKGKLASGDGIDMIENATVQK
jgi:uncharacterized peroxidase-related enzyme